MSDGRNVGSPGQFRTLAGFASALSPPQLHMKAEAAAGEAVPITSLLRRHEPKPMRREKKRSPLATTWPSGILGIALLGLTICSPAPNSHTEPDTVIRIMLPPEGVPHVARL